MARSLNLTKPLEEADDKVQHGVTDLVLCHVRGQNAAAGDYGSALASSVISNELPKSVGQIANETITQSTYNLFNVLTIFGSRLFNFFEKPLNFLGEVRGTILTTLILPILPRHPQDPVYGFLQVGGGVEEGNRLGRIGVYVRVTSKDIMTQLYDA
ncbi:uncharacterized protein BcabD6B2_28360 [Babesia caballi]|uniref:Uncharacterized protein n=1 Tax=Babesia caballi TaxID=5871 RepID=A0AAV4LWB1_BABCB|nr:hypothetical protein BcabD6B2_28360 [Babesia caballi]